MSFEDELGEALRRTGEEFTTDRGALVDAGERRGRRLVARRRAAVVGGSALALAVIGTAGAWTGGLIGGLGSGASTVAASGSGGPSGPSTAGGAKSRIGTGAVSAEQLVGVLTSLLPGGLVSDTTARGTGDEPGPMVSGVYDDGKGKAAINVSLGRTNPQELAGTRLLECPDENLQEFDSCKVEDLGAGSRLLTYQGYEYPDRREDTKRWRTVLVTAEGYQVDVQEWNAAAEKGAPVSRSNPPLSPAQLKSFTTSPLWLPALQDLPAAPAPSENGQAAQPATGAALRELLEQRVKWFGVPVVTAGGVGDQGYVVLDEGKGRSLVEVEVQRGNEAYGALAQYFEHVGYTTLPDGTKMVVKQEPGEKGGAGVVRWFVDTLRPDGSRIIVSAYNSKNQNAAATRAEPALTMDQLKSIATSEAVIAFAK
ncbi:hypothetical protein ACGFYU_08410 [Streptomyces sp. NPDC048337]|uniref:hypothetical protein n=1 Tax=Streptomyces sp. NPDC048337 TaxID=3365535 RepID=UPI003720300D